ncbi:TPA: hypothetical protein ACVU5P_004222 [Vibrio parahaemolyticus]
MNSLEVQELAGAALGLTEDQVEEVLNGDEDFDTPLLEKFGVNLEQFEKVAKALILFTPSLRSELSGQRNHCFVKQTQFGFMAIASTPVEEPGND